MNDASNAKDSAGGMDVAYVARLARLHLSGDEVASFQAQLDGIVGYMRTIARLDLSGIEPTSHAQPVGNVFRPDEEVPGLEHETVMKNAPCVLDGQYCVPKIME